jgi:hypothetical protein
MVKQVVTTTLYGPRTSCRSVKFENRRTPPPRKPLLAHVCSLGHFTPSQISHITSCTYIPSVSVCTWKRIRTSESLLIPLQYNDLKHFSVSHAYERVSNRLIHYNNIMLENVHWQTDRHIFDMGDALWARYTSFKCLAVTILAYFLNFNRNITQEILNGVLIC